MYVATVLLNCLFKFKIILEKNVAIIYFAVYAAWAIKHLNFEHVLNLFPTMSMLL